MKPARILAIVLFCLMGTGCVSARDYDRALYGCVNCELPETRADGENLIYVMRPPTFFNAYQENDLYLASAGAEQYAGSMIGNTYCPIRTAPGETLLLTRIGKYASPSVTLPAGQAGIHYVLLDFDGRWLKPKVTLTLIDAERGEALLRNVQGRCHPQPHAVRIRQRSSNP